MKPTPAGVLVTGRMGTFPSPRLNTCEGHLWLTFKPKRNKMWQSGYCQSARCVVCDETIPAIDSAWWMERATPGRIRLAMEICKDESIRLKQVHRYLSKQLKRRREE